MKCILTWSKWKFVEAFTENLARCRAERQVLRETPEEFKWNNEQEDYWIQKLEWANALPVGDIIARMIVDEPPNTPWEQLPAYFRDTLS